MEIIKSTNGFPYAWKAGRVEQLIRSILEDKARKQLNHWTPSTLAGAVIAVAQADADIKGAAADPIHSLERAIISITARK